MRIDTNSMISAQQNAIITTGTAQSLSAYAGTSYISTSNTLTDLPCRKLAIQSYNANVSTIAVGPAGTVAMSSGWVLSADSITLDVDNLNKVQVVGTANDVVGWIAIIE